MDSLPSPTAPIIAQQTIAAMTPDTVAELARRLEADNYASPFEALQDWHLLRAIALQRPGLTEDYLYLLDFEAFDEA
jgi:Protein of unknown function (DUF2555)